MEITIADEDGNIICTQGEEIVSKYRQYETQIEIPENISDGSYFVKLEGYMNYKTENPMKHSISIPLKVDRGMSFVKECKLDGNAIEVDIYDYSGIKCVFLADVATGEQYTKVYDSYATDDKIVYTFEENATPNLSNIKLEILDNAMNVSTYFLGGVGGNFSTHMSKAYSDKEFYGIMFDIVGDEKLSGASLILAFYDDNGRFMHADVMNDQTVSTGNLIFTGDFDISTADKCKLFIWRDSESLKPLDTVKIFDINMCEIIS